jgi:hypothetical protein
MARKGSPMLSRPGFDGIEHATFMTAGGVHHDLDLFNVMAARRVFVSVPVAAPRRSRLPPHAESESPQFS